MTPPPPKMPNDPLIAAYLERRANLVRYFTARTGSPALADDLAQDLYIKITTRTALEAENPAALLFRMALNVMRDRRRGDLRAAARDSAWRDLAHATMAGHDVADEPRADDAAAARERLRAMIAAVEALPPQMQRAFRLHKLEGHSHAETAHLMGISVKSVEKHISAALKALTTKLGGWDG